MRPGVHAVIAPKDRSVGFHRHREESRIRRCENVLSITVTNLARTPKELLKQRDI
jgi:tRNA G18 (ribose-2'-O)-methylase SpoU